VEKLAECLLPEDRLSHYFNRTEAVRAQSGCALGPRQQVTEHRTEETIMAWTTPTLVEICIGLEINGYLPAEF
jgi:coenzyme PQQ precursor peptide PqqA